ncbi:hypothetical protein JCM8097_009267 [Rhodosporidiobolus ruineniae]
MAALPPGLGGDPPALPPPPASSSSTSRPDIPRSTSSFSLSSASSKTSASGKGGGNGRRVSLYDPDNLAFPSPSRSRPASVASTSSSTRRRDSDVERTPRPHSLHSSSSTTSFHRSGRPISNIFPSRPSSVHSRTGLSPSSSYDFLPSSSPPPPVPALPASASSASISSSAASRPRQRSVTVEDPLGGVFAPAGTGTGQMDELVRGMSRQSSRSKGKEREREREKSAASEFSIGGAAEEEARQERRRRRRRQRENPAAALDEWTRGGGPISSASASASSADEEGSARRSRETSAAFSDASFASMTALPSAGELAGPLPPSSSSSAHELHPVDEADLDITGAPSMERQETLKALERPWMASLVGTGTGAGGDGQKTTIEEIVGRYKGQLREAAGGTGRYDPSSGRRRMSLAVLDLSPVDQAQLALEGMRVVEEVPPPPPPPPEVEVRPPSPPLPYVPFPHSASTSSSLSTPPSLGVSQASPNRIKSIEEIIAEHAGATYLAKRKQSASEPPPVERERERSAASRTTKSSFDSVGEEIRLAAARSQEFLASEENGTPPRSATAAKRVSTYPAVGPAQPLVDSLVHDEFDARSVRSATPSSRAPSTPRVASPKPFFESPSSSSPAADLSSSSSSSERDLARLLKSPRLTRLFTLRPRTSATSFTPPLTVSLADVGSPTGHPVLVFLGLGSVRYLVALYDEVASALGLRLICVDRWGLGRTAAVPDSERGFAEWAEVVAELVGPSCLDLSSPFSLLAHSAGAPYAYACATHPALAPLVQGAVHLLAPWIATPAGQADSLKGRFAMLRYVPAGVLKTAQAADQRVQAWRLGKPPVGEKARPVGYDASRGRLVGAVDEEVEREERERRNGAPVEVSKPFSPAGAAKVVELYGSDAGVIVAGPANGVTSSPSGNGAGGGAGGGKTSKGWKLLNGFRSSSSASSPPVVGGGADDPSTLNGIGASPSPTRSALRPPSFLARRLSVQSGFDVPASTSSAASSRTLSPSGLPMPARRGSVRSLVSFAPDSPTTPTRSDSISSLAGHGHGPLLSPNGSGFSVSTSASNSSSLLPRSHSSLSTSTSSAPPPVPSFSSVSASALIDGLLRASYAESLSGGTSDLLVLLERTSSSSAGAKKALGFAYADLEAPLKVWYGDRDDRISLASVRWLEREVKERGRDGRCEVKVVEGADHGLMANGKVMFEVLESIAADWSTRPSTSS